MNKTLEVTAKMSFVKGNPMNNPNGLLDTEAGVYSLWLPNEIQGDAIRKVHACATLKSAIDTAYRNGDSIEEINLKYRSKR